MISTQGMTSMLALTLIERERDKFEAGIENDPTSKREISAFKERIGSITTVDELMEDYEVYSFVMKAFGMGEKTAGRAMNKKIMTSDVSDKQSLVNRLTDANFKALNATMGFDTDGIASDNFLDEEWVDSMVDRYVDQRLVDTQSVMNENTGIGLHFQQKVSGFTSWYKVLADEDASKFLRVALGLPESIASADIDAQARAFAKKMDIEDLQDPDMQKSLSRRFAAIADANEAATNITNAAVILLNSSTNSGTWSPITLDIEAVSGYSRSGY